MWVQKIAFEVSAVHVLFTFLTLIIFLSYEYLAIPLCELHNAPLILVVYTDFVWQNSQIDGEGWKTFSTTIRIHAIATECLVYLYYNVKYHSYNILWYYLNEWLNLHSGRLFAALFLIVNDLNQRVYWNSNFMFVFISFMASLRM